MNPVLAVEALGKRFRGLVAVDNVSFCVDPNSIFAVVGPNGAGKTTMFNLITGIYIPTSGSIRFKGLDLTAPAPLPYFPLVKRTRRPYMITRTGIGRTFQNIRLFGNMTATENVMVGIDAHNRAGVGSAMARTGRQRREEVATTSWARELLDFVRSCQA